MTNGNTLTTKWALGIAMSVLIMGGGAWMTFVQNQINTIESEQKAGETRASQGREDTGVIKEQVQELRSGQKRNEESQKEMNRKLDELLRRR